MVCQENIENLRCPYCQSSIHKNKGSLVCGNCKRIFEIRDGIPVFTEEGDQADLNEVEDLISRLRSMPDSELNSEATGIEAYFRLPRRKHILARSYTEEKNLKGFFSRFPDLSDLRILNISCGAGLEAQLLLERGAKDVYLLDISHPAILYARECFDKFYPKNKLHYFVGNACSCYLPFPDRFFDILLIYGAIHHYPQENTSYIKEFSRVAKNVCIVDEPAKIGPLQWILDLIGWNTEYGDLETIRFDEKEFRKLFPSDMEVETERFVQYFPEALEKFGNNKTFVKAWFLFLKFLDVTLPSSIKPTLSAYAAKNKRLS